MKAIRKSFVIVLILIIALTTNLLPKSAAATGTSVHLHATISPESEVALITVSATVNGNNYVASSAANPASQGDHWNLDIPSDLSGQFATNISVTVTWKDGTTSSVNVEGQSAIGNGLWNVFSDSITKPTPTSYDVIYQVTGDEPATHSAIPATASYSEGDPVTVAGPLTTTETTKGALTGTWTFNGWTTSDVTVSGGAFTMPDSNVTLTGTWTFTEADKYDVTYQVTGDAPAAYSAIPATASYYEGVPVTVAGPLTTTETTKGALTGTWTFNGWTTSDVTVSGGAFTMPGANVMFTGTWVFTEADKFDVIYQVTGAAPAAYSAIPATVSYYEGVPVTVAGPLTTTETTNGGLTGTWTFNGWTTPDVSVSGGAFTMPGANVTLTGTWTFTEAGKYSVVYQVTGPAPATYSAIPATASYYEGVTVTVAGPLTTTQTTNGALTGTWTFSGWATTDVAVSGGTFAMPTHTVVLTGTWTFTEEERYSVIYQVTGPTPATYSAIPATASYYEGVTVTVAGPLTTTQTTNGALTGTWTFSGWATTDVAVSGGTFAMPTHTVVLTGTWTFTEEERYSVIYQVTGPAPATFSPIPATVSYYEGVMVTVAGPLTTSETTNGALTGTWVFNGWSTTDVTVSGGAFAMPTHTVVLTGTWTFVADVNEDDGENGEVAGDVDKPEDGEVAGDSDELPNAGGLDVFGLMLISGIALLGTSVTTFVFSRKRGTKNR